MKINKQELFKTIGYIGAVLVVAGYIRYSVQETLTLTNKIMLIGGGALLLIAIIFNFAAIRAYFSRRSAKLGTNTAVMSVAVIAILAMANFLGYRHHKRFDLTAEKLYSLSDQTRKIVSSLQKDVKVMKFDKTQDINLRDLMTEYRDLSRHISYELIDPQEKIDVAKQYGVTRMGEIIVTSGNRTERIDEVNEQELTNTILKVTRDSVKTVYFVEGHGEKSLSSSEMEGYSTVERVLKDENYQVKTVNLISTNQVPSDCSVLVVAGPTKSFFPQEVAMIGKYLDGGGKALIMVDPDIDSQLDDIFKAWNIEVGKNTVIDASGVGRIFGTGPGVPLVINYGSHAITKNFERTMTFFPFARSVKTADSSKSDPQITELLKTSSESWAETKLVGRGAEFNEGEDTKGPISLGVAASKKIGDKEARLVVIGDSDFAINRYIGAQRNGDLFFNSINWLAEDEDLIAIRPKSPTDRRVTLTESQQNMLFWFSLVFLPGAVFASGVYIWWKRR